MRRGILILAITAVVWVQLPAFGLVPVTEVLKWSAGPVMEPNDGGPNGADAGPDLDPNGLEAGSSIGPNGSGTAMPPG